MPSISAIVLAVVTTLAAQLALAGPAVDPAHPAAGKAGQSAVHSAATTKKTDEPPPREVFEIDTNTCVTCHSSQPEPKYSTPAKQFVTSVHADDRIGCVGCHKGDPRDPTVRAHDREGGFTSKPSEQGIVTICGGCHSDAPFIRRFNARLRTDQGDLFPLSLHGKLATAGDPNAPTCATCHGYHDVVAVSSLLAPTHPRNVANLCARCHENPALMNSYGLPINEKAKWQRSAHARALLGGNPQAPSCTGCHGPHSATPPRATTVGRVCGQCHPDQLEAFRQSPHSKAYRKLGLSECVPCHDPHEARRSSWDINSSEFVCNRCHAKDAVPRQVAAELSRIVTTARARLDRAKARYEALKAQGINVHGAQYSLDQLDTEQQKLSITLHSLNPGRLRLPMAAVIEAADRSEKLISAAQRERQMRRRGYFVALGLAVLLLLLLVAKSVQLARQRSRSKA
jgi:predicted CXXCH cytochrome family protein